jgi:hypothetical protein
MLMIAGRYPEPPGQIADFAEAHPAGAGSQVAAGHVSVVGRIAQPLGGWCLAGGVACAMPLVG